MEGSTNSKNTNKPVIPTNLWLGMMKFLLVFPTQPLMVIKGRQQTALLSRKPRALSISQAAGEIKKGQSYAAFFRGAPSAAVKEFMRNTVYKGPLIKGAPKIAEHLLPASIMSSYAMNTTHLIRAATAGTFAGLAENVFGGIFETVSTFQLTAQGRYAQYSFYRELKKQPSFQAVVSRLYRGFIPSTIKSSVAFTTYFATSPYLKKLSYQLYQVDKKSPLPWYATLTTAISSGFAVAVISTPFDIVKTQIQRPGARNLSMFQALMQNYQLHGIKRMTTGMGMNLSLVTLGWCMNFLATANPSSLSEDESMKVTPSE